MKLYFILVSPFDFHRFCLQMLFIAVKNLPRQIKKKANASRLKFYSVAPITRLLLEECFVLDLLLPIDKIRRVSECCIFLRKNLPLPLLWGKQEFRRTDFGSRLLAAEGEGGEDRCG